ncbi:MULTISPECIES: ImmA/IrrE family metallo-endopeptidase [Gammaproteobacteria]|uniref:ImmA/IrrE family metallo-endopeptidase n=1 Tax=Gammaproteobacteria TaxID=1236 RepID=UPI0004E3D3F5|nr:MULTISPECIES: ImmA/IrrE family metallo-endopeptidase [Gammaproteobacteria]EGQ8013968.1 ImmA/IrrE family metallo-endopeptidase [Vibrio cholerae]EGQ9854200.1 ImmA/IrrE family metallo-endopeptidase [Vibrio cholerae]EGR0581192.1 ImmA/IrrE family metallo-endopeptidase [Vibrio cholerae]EKF9795355.1 ImmA/IrrE family metallo-endopeptidase [Vibrio cholerae]ELH0899627.1 ImmA/IrrE family metallo-endopeptidase [Vibrio cholerae]
MEEQKGAKEAESLLEDLGFDQLPIKVNQFINTISDESFPIRVEFHAFVSDQFLGKAIGNQDGAGIIINSNIPDSRRLNFTAAHETGHVCMHIMQGHSKDFECGNSELGDYFKDPLERQANGFASGLLMPKRLVKPLTDGDVNWHNIKQISDLCDTSLEAVFRRLSWLEKAPVAMVIHQNKQFKRFVPTKYFNFYINQTNLSSEQLASCTNVSQEAFPSDFDVVDPIDWVTPERDGMKLLELYASSIVLKDGFIYTLLSYDDDCLEEVDTYL